MLARLRSGLTFANVIVTIAADGNPAHARVLFHTTSNLQTDTSFMIAAFC